MHHLLAVTLALAAPVAQEEPATLEQALAVAVARAMPDLRYPWQLGWSAFGSYGSRDIHWHLIPPDRTDPQDPTPARITRRNGWMSINGRTASVSVCGDDQRIGAMRMEASDIWLGDGDIVPELADAGVVATLLERRDLPPILADGPRDDLHPQYVDTITARPAHRLTRLEQAGREPALLTATYSCTGPGTRSATRCTMHWSLELRAGPSPRAAQCLAPPEPLSSQGPS